MKPKSLKPKSLKPNLLKPNLLGLLILSSLAAIAPFSPEVMGATLAIATLNTGSISNGVFYASSDRAAALRFEFKLAQHVLFNRAGSSEISFLNPFTGKDVALEVTKGEPYPADPADYLQSLTPVVATLEIPKNAKAGVYNVKLIADVFLCEAILKVCYVEQTPGSFEIRVSQTGRDTPVKLEYIRPQR